MEGEEKMKIKIVGNNSSNRMKLLKNTRKACNEVKENIVIELVEDNNYLKKFNITNTPGLIINEKLVSQGKVVNEREIKNFIRILS